MIYMFIISDLPLYLTFKECVNAVKCRFIVLYLFINVNNKFYLKKKHFLSVNTTCTFSLNIFVFLSIFQLPGLSAATGNFESLIEDVQSTWDRTWLFLTRPLRSTADR